MLGVRFVLAALAGTSTVFAASVSDLSPDVLHAFNSTVSGRLFEGRPLALPCYTSYSNGSATVLNSNASASQCASIQQSKNDPTFISNNFGGYITYNFAACVATGAGCPLGAILPVDPVSPLTSVCAQGAVPSYYVDARNAGDVQAALPFATQHSLPLVVKNTGHDYRGRSNAPGSLAIWTHNIQPAIRLDKAFQPDGCLQSAGPALTYGAGQQFQGLYDKAYENGYMLIGGGSPTVGASGGWVTGGGHSFASPTYGLGVDNVLQMRAVLPNGTYVTANRCQNPDIFFALRGGGGGTFGVVMETTTRLYTAVPMQMASITALSVAPDSKTKFLDVMVKNAAQWARDGWGGYVGPDYAGGHALQVSLVTPKLTLDEAKASMKPLTDFAQGLRDLRITVSSNITTLQSGYHEFINTPFVKAFNVLNNVGVSLVSRLIPKTQFADAKTQADLTSALGQIVAGGKPNALIPFYVLFVPPSSFDLPDSDKAGGPGAASVTPAWRTSYWHIVAESFWDATDRTASGAGSVTAAFRNGHDSITPLRQLLPNSGAYQNEADPFEPDPIGSFWGADNYARLLKIKRRIDPQNVLTCYNCVGWDAADPRYGCYPKI